MHEYKIPSPKNLSMTAERKKLSRRFGQHAETKILAGPCRPSRITQPAELKFEQNVSLIFLGFLFLRVVLTFIFIMNHCSSETTNVIKKPSIILISPMMSESSWRQPARFARLFPDFGLKYNFFEFFFAFSVYKIYHVTVLISGQFSNFFLYPTFKMI
jgi:hypothetical protein